MKVMGETKQGKRKRNTKSAAEIKLKAIRIILILLIINAQN